jgi:L-lactate dehydrogenase (cytochrome)
VTDAELAPEVVPPAAAAVAAERPPVPRRLPRWSEVSGLVRLRRPALDPVQRRLDAALTIADLRRIATRTTPRAVFDYVDGAADAGVTAARNRAAFCDVTFVPEVLQSVADPDLSTVLGGRRISLPLGLAPTGYTRMMHHHGEEAVARVAQRAGLPYVLSTMGTTTIEDVHDAAPQGDNWFQLYLTNDEALNAELVDRALAAGSTTLLLTVDTAVGGRRLRDVRNGLTIPPALTAATLVDMARFPAWWANKLTTPPLEFASVRHVPGGSAYVAALLFDPRLSYAHLAWLRRRWPHRLLVKGVVNPQDARRVVSLGADGVVVSNHGGRQLDRAPVPFHLLPGVVEAVGGINPALEVHLDTGITSGQDIVAAVAHGAHFTLIGRAYLYGLMAGGREGVDRAIDILRGQIERTMRLLGVTTLDELTPDHVTQLHRLAPRPRS